jgi:hypothetical protein
VLKDSDFDIQSPSTDRQPPDLFCKFVRFGNGKPRTIAWITDHFNTFFFRYGITKDQKRVLRRRFYEVNQPVESSISPKPQIDQGIVFGYFRFITKKKDPEFRESNPSLLLPAQLLVPPTGLSPVDTDRPSLEGSYRGFCF